MSHRWRILIFCGSVVACFDAKFPGPNARCFTCLTFTESLVGAANRYHGELEKHGVLRTLPGRHIGAGSACKCANNRIYRQIQQISVVEYCDDHGDSPDTHDSYHHVPGAGRLSRTELECTVTGILVRFRCESTAQPKMCAVSLKRQRRPVASAVLNVLSCCVGGKISSISG